MKKLLIKEILTYLKHEKYVGNQDVEISEILDLINKKPTNQSQLFWCSDKNSELLHNLTSGTVIVSNVIAQKLSNKNLNLIVVENPRAAFKVILEQYFLTKPREALIASSAVIHSTAKISENVEIGCNVVIEEGCVIGVNCRIGHNTVIMENTIIGDNVKIGSNNTIGGVGFGYEQNIEKNWELMPHLGNVIIKNNVEIGNNTCIDRAVLGSTVLESNVKIDNLVHIAHGVKIHENSLIIAQAMVGGSAIIGKNVWFGPSASLLNKGVVEDDALIGMGAVVVKHVDSNAVVAGNPARFLRRNREIE